MTTPYIEGTRADRRRNLAALALLRNADENQVVVVEALSLYPTDNSTTRKNLQATVGMAVKGLKSLAAREGISVQVWTKQVLGENEVRGYAKRLAPTAEQWVAEAKADVAEAAAVEAAVEAKRKPGGQPGRRMRTKPGEARAAAVSAVDLYLDGGRHQRSAGAWTRKNSKLSEDEMLRRAKSRAVLVRNEVKRRGLEGVGVRVRSTASAVRVDIYNK